MGLPILLWGARQHVGLPLLGHVVTRAGLGGTRLIALDMTELLLVLAPALAGRLLLLTGRLLRVGEQLRLDSVGPSRSAALLPIYFELNGSALLLVHLPDALIFLGHGLLDVFGHSFSGGVPSPLIHGLSSSQMTRVGRLVPLI